MVYTKDDLLSKVRDDKSKAEAHYVETGPRKREQEAHYGTGVSVVGMNVELLVDWLDQHSKELLSIYEDLSKADRREVWEASGFHFGMMGYEKHDADFWWTHEA